MSSRAPGPVAPKKASSAPSCRAPCPAEDDPTERIYGLFERHTKGGCIVIDVDDFQTRVFVPDKVVRELVLDPEGYILAVDYNRGARTARNDYEFVAGWAQFHARPETLCDATGKVVIVDTYDNYAVIENKENGKSVLLQPTPADGLSKDLKVGDAVTFSAFTQCWMEGNLWRALSCSTVTHPVVSVKDEYSVLKEHFIPKDRNAHRRKAAHKRKRKMLGITLLHRRSNVRLREATGVRDVRKEAGRRKLVWAMKIANMEGDRWPRRIAEWTLREFKRKPGGQKTRWKDTVGSRWLAAPRPDDRPPRRQCTLPRPPI